MSAPGLPAFNHIAADSSEDKELINLFPFLRVKTSRSKIAVTVSVKWSR